MSCRTLEIHRSELKFSAGHFTIFSKTHREALHGHNYSVGLAIQVQDNEFGIAFDYRDYKKKIVSICAQLDGKLLLPEYSPYLQIQLQEKQCLAEFNGESFSFPKNDVVVLPIRNTTLEDLSAWMLERLRESAPEMVSQGIMALTVRVFNGAQSGSTRWDHPSA